MDLLETWQKLEREKLSKPVEGAVEIRKTSRHPVEQLKAAYMRTTLFSVFFLAGFIVLFFLFEEPLVKVGIGFVVGVYVFFFVVNFGMYRRVGMDFPVDRNLKDALNHTYSYITENIRFQERAALFLYPIGGAAGFMMGGSVGSGDINSMMMKPSVLILLVVVLVVMTPLCFYLTRWMYKVSYGKCLSDLKTLIEDLERPN